MNKTKIEPKFNVGDFVMHKSRESTYGNYGFISAINIRITKDSIKFDYCITCSWYDEQHLNRYKLVLDESKQVINE